MDAPMIQVGGQDHTASVEAMTNGLVLLLESCAEARVSETVQLAAIAALTASGSVNNTSITHSRFTNKDISN